MRVMDEPETRESERSARTRVLYQRILDDNAQLQRIRQFSEEPEDG